MKISLLSKMQNSITKSHDPNPSDNLESNNLRSQEYIANKSINPTLNYYELFVVKLYK